MLSRLVQVEIGDGAIGRVIHWPMMLVTIMLAMSHLEGGPITTATVRLGHSVPSWRDHH